MAHVLCADNVGEPMRSDECAEIFTEVYIGIEQRTTTQRTTSSIPQ